MTPRALKRLCSLTQEAKHLVGERTLGLIKPATVLINTGRGPLVDEAALAEALNAGRIGGAGLDVLTVEPPAGGSPLIGARNCLITPHIGWATKEARARLIAQVVENVRAWQAGSPVNVVS